MVSWAIDIARQIDDALARRDFDRAYDLSDDLSLAISEAEREWVAQQREAA